MYMCGDAHKPICRLTCAPSMRQCEFCAQLTRILTFPQGLHVFSVLIPMCRCVNNLAVCTLAIDLSKQTCFISPLAAPETRQSKTMILITAPCFFTRENQPLHALTSTDKTLNVDDICRAALKIICGVLKDSSKPSG